MNKICHLKLSTYLMRDIKCRDYRFISKKAENYDNCVMEGSTGDVIGRYDGHSIKKWFNLMRFKIYKFMLQTGSIMPDILVYTYIKGHEYSGSFEKIKSKILKLEEKGKWSIRSCYRLGYLLHYLEDYFTYPHNNNFTLGLMKHREYEVGLQPKFLEYLKNRWKDKQNDNLEAYEHTPAMDIFNKMHDDYMMARPVHERDCRYIVDSAERIAAAFFLLFEKRAEKRYFEKVAVAL